MTKIVIVINPPICANCIHHKTIVGYDEMDEEDKYICTHPKCLSKPSIITGKRLNTSCCNARHTDYTIPERTMCGKEGKYYEQQ